MRDFLSSAFSQLFAGSGSGGRQRAIAISLLTVMLRKLWPPPRLPVTFGFMRQNEFVRSKADGDDRVWIVTKFPQPPRPIGDAVLLGEKKTDSTWINELLRSLPQPLADGISDRKFCCGGKTESASVRRAIDTRRLFFEFTGRASLFSML
jgi:hypothetical protein